MTNPFLQPAAQPQQAPAPAAPAANPFGGQVATAPPAVPPYGPAAQAAGVAATPPALNMGGLKSAAAPIVGNGAGARLKDMYGRLVLVFPLGIERVPRSQQYITAEQRARGDIEQDRLTATVVVLDDGQGGQQPIQFGGDPYALPPKPHTESAPLPYVRKAMWINQSRLISQLREGLPSVPGQAPEMIAGRVAKAGPANNDPWYLIGATGAEVTLVRQYLEAVQAGAFPHPLA